MINLKDGLRRVPREVRRIGDAMHKLAYQLEQPANRKPTPKSREEITRSIGNDWRQVSYYDQAEPFMETSWRDLLWPLISDCDFSVVVDLAAGHGRNSEMLRRHAERIYIVDINQENIDFCRQRFAGDSKFSFVGCDGLSFPEIPASTVTLMYCFDAMVHFDSDTVRAYLGEFRRVLKPGGRGLCHHSNYTARPSADFHQSPCWRNFMSQQLFEHYCHKEGLRVLRSQVIDWWDADAEKGAHKGLDCLTLFELPA